MTSYPDPTQNPTRYHVAPIAGTAIITQGDKLGATNNLTVRNGHVALTVTARAHGSWKIRPFGPDGDQFAMVFTDTEGDEELAMTLSDTPDNSGVCNAFAKPLMSPPPPEQLWTLEAAIREPREPPTIHGRIQSVARKDLSAGIGGEVDLPPRNMPVSGMPNTINQDLKWILEYQP